jgi:hypothetical protein
MFALYFEATSKEPILAIFLGPFGPSEVTVISERLFLNNEIIFFITLTQPLVLDPLMSLIFQDFNTVAKISESGCVLDIPQELILLSFRYLAINRLRLCQQQSNRGPLFSNKL